MMKFFKRNKKGFSLVELIVVIAILGILATIVVPRIAGQSEQARIAADAATLRSIQGAVAMFHAQNGVFPPDDGAPPANSNADYLELRTHLANFLDLGDPAVMPTAQQAGQQFRYNAANGRVSIGAIPPPPPLP